MSATIRDILSSVLSGSPDEHDFESDGWTEQSTSWTDSYVAASLKKFEHEDGASLHLWGDLPESEDDPSSSENDGYTVELYDDDQELLVAEPFDTRDAAKSWLDDLRAAYPDIDEFVDE